MKKYCLSFILMACMLNIAWAQTNLVNQYTVNWDAPSENAAGSMPIGNGEVGANVWMEKNGNLVFYLSRTDAWSENSALYKLGRVRVSLSPFKIDSQTAFKQYLNLEKGVIEFEIDKGSEKVELYFLVDSESPVVYLRGKSTIPLQVNVSSEIWRTQARLVPDKERHFALQNCPYDSLAMEYPDRIVSDEKNLIVCHRNEHSIYPFTMKHQGLSGGSDPLLNRTMGYCVTGDGFSKISPTILSSEDRMKDFTLKIVAYTEQTSTLDEWVESVKEIGKQAPSFEEASWRTALWWKNYWDRSYIVVHTPDQKTGSKITQSYILQKWMNACGGRGNYPIKFNGSIFTVDPGYSDPSKNYNPDFRLWGPDYWWQNTRLIYHPMLKTGDFDMMRVLFRHYKNVLPMLRQNAKVLWNAEGAVNPETATIFGATVDHDYGWTPRPEKKEVLENPYVRYYWSSGLEIAGLMCDFYQYTQDIAFAKDTLIPFASEILKFYDSFFPKDENGKIQITPTHALETYWENVRNDMPNVAGLHYVLRELLALPKDAYAATLRNEWQKMQQALPELPSKLENGKKIFTPAETYSPKQTNMENPELYTVFPFQLCNISTKDVQVGIDTYNHRIIQQTNCWTQDGQQAARLGLTEEAAKNLLAKIENKNPNHRFPVIWGPNYDWAPDEDHGGNLLMTLQEMVMQAYGNKVYVLPAFPKDWDVSFKLYTLQNNIIEGEYKDRSWYSEPKFANKTKQKIVKK